MQKSNSKSQSSNSGPAFSVHDVLFVLFKHKWKILLLSLLGFGIATALYLQQEPVYKSESKLLIRYVLTKGIMDPFEDMNSPGGGSRGRGDPVINTEIEILKSVDLSLNVAEGVGVKRLLPHEEGKASLESAAGAIRKGLEVLPGQSSSVLYVNYAHKNAELSKEVLDELLKRYFERHLEIHRSAAAFDLVAKQAEKAKAVLQEKEAALDRLRKETGIMALADATAALTAQKSKTQEELLKARADLVEKMASLAALEKGSNISELTADDGSTGAPGMEENTTIMAVPSSSAITEYRAVKELIGFLQKRELELRVKFKPGNRLIALNREQLAVNEARCQELERRYPGLTTQPDSVGADPGNPQAQWMAEKASVVSIQAKIEMLNAQLKEIGEQFVREYVVGAKVEELKRERDILDSEYRTLETKLKSAKVETTLDPSHMPNITIIQKPTEPIKTLDEKMRKIILGIAGSGIGLGLTLAFLIELLFNRKINRPTEIQTRLQLPLMLSIPFFAGRSGGRFIPSGQADPPLLGGGDGNADIIPADDKKGRSPLARAEHFILPYAETLRDRIIFNFEINNVLHKPKFIAVAGLSERAGASTIAAGLAKSFSEMKGAKVLLVDLSSIHPEENPVFGEMPLHSIHGALALTGKKDFEEASQNLYYASAIARRDETGLASFTPIQLYEIMPQLQASAYDYVVFDMPPIDETSRTLAMAGMMDKMLLVLDGENTNRDALKWGYSELVKGKADVSCVFNKTRTVAPGWLLGEN